MLFKLYNLNMTRKRKRQIYCMKCGYPSEWYKKGKKRVLMCQSCGVIAHNPSKFKKLLDIGTDFVPGGRVAKTALSFAGINPLEEKSQSVAEKPHRARHYSAENRLNEALHG